MIREVETLDSTLVAAPLGAMERFAPESIELEINRLTWAVLDGSASSSDRTRLAELVQTQHALRPRVSA